MHFPVVEVQKFTKAKQVNPSSTPLDIITSFFGLWCCLYRLNTTIVALKVSYSLLSANKQYSVEMLTQLCCCGC